MVLHAFEANMVDFDAVSVENLVKMVVLGKCLSSRLFKKIFGDNCGYIFTKRGINSDHISFVVTFAVHFCINSVVLYFLLIAILL